MGINYSYKKDYQKAIELIDNALEILQKNETVDENLIDCYINLGLVYGEENKYQKAIENYNKALSITIDLFGSDHFLASKIYNNIGGVQ